MAILGFGGHEWHFLWALSFHARESQIYRGAAANATAAGKRYILGVYDARFDRLQGIRHHPQLLAITDQNDLDVTLLNSACLDRVIAEFGDQEKVHAFVARKGITIREHIQVLAHPFGCLRYLNQVLNHGVDFDELSPYRFLPSTSWELDHGGPASGFWDRWHFSWKLERRYFGDMPASKQLEFGAGSRLPSYPRSGVEEYYWDKAILRAGCSSGFSAFPSTERNSKLQVCMPNLRPSNSGWGNPS